MEDKIKELQAQMAEAMKNISSREELADFWQTYLGKNGQVAGLMKNLRSVSKEDRPTMGKLVNQLKKETEERYQKAKEKQEALELAARDKKEQIGIGVFHIVTNLDKEVEEMGGVVDMHIETGAVGNLPASFVDIGIFGIVDRAVTRSQQENC